MEYREHLEWTPRSEAWVEAASWIAEEKRARPREDLSSFGVFAQPRLSTVHATAAEPDAD